MPNLTFSAQGRSESPTKTVVDSGGFTITIDEPENLGGTNLGANPVQYVLAALSGCLNVVSHMVANEMGFQLRGLDIALDGELNPAKFTGKSLQGRAGYENINVTLRPDTDADQKTLDMWRTAVESRCPVSDNISNTTPVHITVDNTMAQPMN